MGTPAKDKSAVRTRRAIVNLLKQEGPTDASVLASCLGVSAMAIRQHLYALQAEKLVTYTEEPRPMGRPAKLWQLTPAADHLFPEGYAELTVGLLKAITEAFGEEGLDRLLAVRTRQYIAAYDARIGSQNSFPERLQALADLRTQEGYMAEIQFLGENSFLLIENHCPICAAASACTGLCTSELEVFQRILGKEAVVERTEHIIAGQRRCVYQVSYREKLSE